MKQAIGPTIREQLEERERLFLAPEAAHSADTKGRLRPQAEDDMRPAFQRDRDRILHCKAFRRLKHKTQVFFSPAGDHYRTRLTHTLEVSQIARTLAKSLRLNEELTALGAVNLAALEELSGARERKKRGEVAKDRAPKFSFDDGLQVQQSASQCLDSSNAPTSRQVLQGFQSVDDF